MEFNGVKQHLRDLGRSATRHEHVPVTRPTDIATSVPPLQPHEERSCCELQLRRLAPCRVFAACIPGRRSRCICSTGRRQSATAATAGGGCCWRRAGHCDCFGSRARSAQDGRRQPPPPRVGGGWDKGLGGDGILVFCGVISGGLRGSLGGLGCAALILLLSGMTRCGERGGAAMHPAADAAAGRGGLHLLGWLGRRGHVFVRYGLDLFFIPCTLTRVTAA